MKFSDYPYTRPDVTLLKKEFRESLVAFEEAASAEEQVTLLSKINDLRESFGSMATLCQIRHTIDTRDEFYTAENDFFDTVGPELEEITNELYLKLTQSKFRASLEAILGRQLFNTAEVGLKTFSSEIMADLADENRLRTEYVKLRGQAKLTFRGEEYNLSTITALEESTDRETRKEASAAKWAFYEANQAAFDKIYDELVTVRNRMARTLGYDNFVQLGYARMNRSDYGPAEVANYRKQIEEHLVPLATELLERQRKRIGIETLKHYDIAFKCKTGNPRPQGQPTETIAHAQKMYHELSPETGAFFDFMLEQGTLDLLSKPGKAPGGYCTYISQYKAPFIYSNFNGTSGDVDVLTHEAGHAFQVYSSRHFEVPEYHWPTMEACEIHSMSMEFFAWPWTEGFFGADNAKYQYTHLVDALTFLPYGVAVDEFQHIIYENPTLTPAQRHDAWLGVQKKYLPSWDQSENEYLSKGCFWQKQAHIFEHPFYYIDYTLAEVCALQFWKRSREDFAPAWKDYLTLCQAGGSRSFVDLVKLANLRSPFSDGCVEAVVKECRQWLNTIDDAVF